MNKFTRNWLIVLLLGCVMDSQALIFFIFRCFNLGLVSFFAYYVFRRSFYPTFKKEIEAEIDATDQLSRSIVEAGQESVQLRQAIEQQTHQTIQLLDNIRNWHVHVEMQQQNYMQAQQVCLKNMHARACIQSKVYQEQIVLCALVPRVLERAQERLRHEFTPGSEASRQFIAAFMQDMQVREKN